MICRIIEHKKNQFGWFPPPEVEQNKQTSGILAFRAAIQIRRLFKTLTPHLLLPFHPVRYLCPLSMPLTAFKFRLSCKMIEMWLKTDEQLLICVNYRLLIPLAMLYCSNSLSITVCWDSDFNGWTEFKVHNIGTKKTMQTRLENQCSKYSPRLLVQYPGDVWQMFDIRCLTVLRRVMSMILIYMRLSRAYVNFDSSITGHL